MIQNTFFKKRDIHKYIQAASGFRSEIDCIITNRKIAGQVIDVRVCRCYDIVSDHYLICCKIEMFARWKQSRKNQGMKGEDVYKAYLLHEERIQLLFQQREASTL